MNFFTLSPRNWFAIHLCLAGCLIAPLTKADDAKRFRNPISRLARAINPKLVQVEDRVTWLTGESYTLAKYNQFPLNYGLGFRGCRATKDGPAPTITLDLGSEMRVDMIYLVPSQNEYLNDTGIFPRRFIIEIADTPDFSNSKTIYRTTTGDHRQHDGIPARFTSFHTGRYVKLTVERGHQKGATDLFGLSEIFIFSEGVPVSLNAKVTTTGNLDSPGYWYPQALIDGRCPLGMWHHGIRADSSIGDAVLIPPDTNNTPPTVWNCDLPTTSDIDRIVLFPYQINRAYETSFFPEQMRIEIFGEDKAQPLAIQEWSNPAPGTSHVTSLVFPIQVKGARSISIIATKPWKLGTRRMNALSEIELWSNERNLATGIPVTRSHNNETTLVTALTDGFTSEKKISPIDIWLEQLYRRGLIEEELDQLRNIYGQLVSQTELNVSWGSAVILGLTFLIPVFIVERRRMQSKEHLDIIRKRIASDLHDDIGSNLGSISLIARTARKDLARLNGPVQIDEDLGEVEMIARESSLAMRDIVWLLERKQDSIGDLVHRMRETAGRLLREIQFTLECTTNKTASKLTLDAKRHLFLFYKEGIHNVIKHSKAKRVAIRLWDEGDQLALEIVDDGVGLPVNRDRTAVSVKKLEDRAEVLNGIMQITSSAETGTCIRLLVKRSYLTTQPKSS